MIAKDLLSWELSANKLFRLHETNSQRSTDPTDYLEPSLISTDTRLNLLHNNTPKPLLLAKRQSIPIVP